MPTLKNETIVTGADGKVMITQKSFNTKVTPDKFYMTFIEHISPLFNLKSPLARRILDIFCCKAEFNTGKVTIPSGVREEICTSLNISLQTFNNTIQKLKKSGLISGERGIYEINPNIFWKGTTDQRDKILREGGLELKIKYQTTDENRTNGTVGEANEGSSK